MRLNHVHIDAPVWDIIYYKDGMALGCDNSFLEEGTNGRWVLPLRCDLKFNTTIYTLTVL